jgi:uncharacterized protein
MWNNALVTGASSGIGEAFVRNLAKVGTKTVVVARRGDRLQALADELPGLTVLTADLATDAGVDTVLARLADGDIDLLVNNAGFGNDGPFHEVDATKAADEIRVNVLALARLTHGAASPMVARKRGGILNVSSIASFQAAPGFGSYAATKAFVTNFTETIHEDLKRHGVHATALCPGLTRSEFHSSAGIDGYDKYPAFVWQTADEVAAFGLAAVAKGDCLAVPGLPNKVLTGASSILPRALTRRLAGLTNRSQ